MALENFWIFVWEVLKYPKMDTTEFPTMYGMFIHFTIHNINSPRKSTCSIENKLFLF